MRPLLVAASLALLIGGCGGSDDELGSSLVDPDRPPLINSFDRDPDSGDLLLTTNRGLFRIHDGDATRIPAEVETQDGRSPVGKFLAIAQSPDGALVGSGHPDDKRRLAGFLGLLRSEDGGHHWQVVSRYAIADLHTIRFLDGTLYAWDAVLPSFIVSSDQGKTWDERSTPPGRIFDFVVDPSDPDYLIASGKQSLFRSTDGGQTWTTAARAAAATLEWPTADVLYRADEDGYVYSSDNQAATWDLVGQVDGNPRALLAVGPDELYAALDDAAIVHSTDGGKSWEEYFSP